MVFYAETGAHRGDCLWQRARTSCAETNITLDLYITLDLDYKKYYNIIYINTNGNIKREVIHPEKRCVNLTRQGRGKSMETHEKLFIDKVERFKDDEKYLNLKGYAEEALRIHKRQEQNRLWAMDFMDKIIIMPESRIRAWLNNEGSLTYTEKDKRMLMAYRGGFLDMQMKHESMEIHKINESMLNHYQQCGYKLLEKAHGEDDMIYVGKPADDKEAETGFDLTI